MLDQFSGLDPKEAAGLRALKKADLVDSLAKLLAEQRTNSTLENFTKKRSVEPPVDEQPDSNQALKKQNVASS